ncbi:hypothetical protein [Agrobacterium pusense]|uniref:hypothetical protein n=1 Tax=Agrobacterium pusense TaxID=648995 RepID=UPI001C6E8290|nr:hypothetical protein [Agrobacterium pusense]MBW9070037.1 hypothetical protein [Agrobacterium pusense]MBW9085123.1 hypothetical protein [Agrobacterium pusense]MBW9125402.1 hypothetical protein [Agrobacterium pusense]MBW9137817.1 hypothetical protein [Agrobacterium pusense]
MSLAPARHLTGDFCPSAYFPNFPGTLALVCGSSWHQPHELTGRIMADVFWLVVVAGGPLLLGAVVFYVLLRQRRLSAKEQQEQVRKVHKPYDGK